MLALATSMAIEGTGSSFMLSSSTWSMIVMLFRPNCSIFSSIVRRSFPLYSTAMTVPSPAMSAASTAMDSPEMMQTVSSDAMCILLRMTARISLPT